MKKRFFKCMGLGLGIFAAMVLILLGIGVLSGFSLTDLLKVFPKVFPVDFAIAFFPFVFSVVIGACLLGVSLPYDKKENRTQAPKKYKIAIVLEIIGILFVSSGLAWLLRSLDNKHHNSLALWVATVGMGLIAVTITGALLAVASTKKLKIDWRNIIIAWIPVLCIVLIAPPWADALPSNGISLPSISLFSKEKTEAKIVADPIQISIDPFQSNAYLAKTTIRNTGNADAESIVVSLYYYDMSGVKQWGAAQTIDYLAAGKSYSLTMRILDYQAYYPYGINDPYLDIHYLSVS